MKNKAEDLFSSCLLSDGHRPAGNEAAAWVEAENTYAIWEVVQKWFEYMEQDTADNNYPDPEWVSRSGLKQLTQELADRLVEEIDEDFGIEKNRFHDLEVEEGPNFCRLSFHARLAFAQEICDTLKTYKEIVDEAENRKAKNEIIPPPEVAHEDVMFYGTW